MTPSPARPSRRQIGAVLRVASGNFLEMYDFMVFGYYALYIANAYFPARSKFVSLMLSLATFGAGFLTRPLGALVLGAYIDRKGRRDGLLVTLTLMALGTLTIAVTPTYESIGLIAPLVVVAGRLLQGLSAGVELGGVSVYLAEIATPGRTGFYCSWQSASQQLAVVLAASLGTFLTSVLTPRQMASWGWRVPMLIGCLVIPVILWMRRSLEETEAFRAQKRRPHTVRKVLRTIRENLGVVLTGVLLVVLTTTTFYLITAYNPTFAERALKLSERRSLFVSVCVGLSSFVLLPFFGHLSDRFGRRPFLVIVPLLAILTAYPAMHWLVGAPSLARLLTVQLWLSLLFAAYNGSLIPWLTEIMPKEVRTAGFSLAYSLATAIFGGFTPAICVLLIGKSGNKAAPALWLTLAAALSLVGALASLATVAGDKRR